MPSQLLQGTARLGANAYSQTVSAVSLQGPCSGVTVSPQIHIHSEPENIWHYLNYVGKGSLKMESELGISRDHPGYRGGPKSRDGGSQGKRHRNCGTTEADWWEPTLGALSEPAPCILCSGSGLGDWAGWGMTPALFSRLSGFGLPPRTCCLPSVSVPTLPARSTPKPGPPPHMCGTGCLPWPPGLPNAPGGQSPAPHQRGVLPNTRLPSPTPPLPPSITQAPPPGGLCACACFEPPRAPLCWHPVGPCLRSPEKSLALPSLESPDGGPALFSLLVIHCLVSQSARSSLPQG